MLRMKKIFGLVFFTILMLLKVSAFHVHTHHDEDCEGIDKCEICDLVLESQTSDLDIPSPSITEIQDIIIIDNYVLLKPEFFSRDSGINLLFSRPPPQA